MSCPMCCPDSNHLNVVLRQHSRSFIRAPRGCTSSEICPCVRCQQQQSKTKNDTVLLADPRTAPGKNPRCKTVTVFVCSPFITHTHLASFLKKIIFWSGGRSQALAIAIKALKTNRQLSHFKRDFGD